MVLKRNKEEREGDSPEQYWPPSEVQVGEVDGSPPETNK